MILIYTLYRKKKVDGVEARVRERGIVHTGIG
jgi:hypothetical protein